MNGIKKIICFFSLVGITIICFESNAKAYYLSDNIQISDYLKLKFQVENEGFELEKIKCKKAYDFSGDCFVIGEQGDKGYFIYSEKCESLVEYSLVACSPFININSNLYYNGPCYYYQKRDAYYVSIDNEITLYEKSIQKKPVISVNNVEVNKLASYNELLPEYAWSVENPEFFYEECSTYCGYINGGKCGYIGLGLLIGYIDKYKNDMVMDNSYYQNPYLKTGMKNGNLSLAQDLYDLNPKNSTTSTQIKDTMNIYAKTRGLKIAYNSKWSPFITNRLIMDSLNDNIPVEFFGQYDYILNGNTTTTGNHAIVAYSMGVFATDLSSTIYKYRCHFGWSGYSDMVVTSYILGSIYCFDCK